MTDTRWVPLAAAYIGAYVLLDWVSFIHPIAPYAITPWNPPPGVSLALLLAKGTRYSPVVFVAVSIAEFSVHGGGDRPGYAFLFAAVLAAGYTAMAQVLLRVARFDPHLATRRDLAVFVVVVAVGTMAVACAYVAAHVAAGDEPWAEFSAHVLRFWIGDVIGVIVTTPFLLVCGRGLAGWKLRRTGAEAALQAIAVFVAVGLVFSMGDVVASKFFYLLFLPLIWIAMRHGFEGAAAALLVTQIALIVAVQIAGYAAASVYDFQLLMLALAVTGLFLGMAASESRRAQAALLAREAELKTIVETAPDAIITADDSGSIIAVNPAAESMFGVSSRMLVGTPVTRVIPPISGRTRAHAFEVRAVRPDGSTFPAEVSLAPTGTAGRVGLIGVLRDVSQRHAMETRLRERESELDRAIRIAAAAELASALAHELNQPLTAAANYIGVCALLLERPDTPRERLVHALGLVESEVGRAGEVVRRLRDFYRGASAQREPVPLAALVESALRITRARMQRYAIEVHTDVDVALPVPLVDRIQIEMVLHNLVANAIEALSGVGDGMRRIDITARRWEAGAVELAVQDSGPGVSDEIAPRLFTTFATSKASGLGLGLAISRSIVEGHGGRLWLDNQRPGARFVLTLPVASEEG